MNPTLITVFAVILSAGSYDDHFTRIVRMFTTRETAERFAARQTHEVNTLNGMIRAVERIMTEWEKSNPSPGYDDHAAYVAYGEKRNAEFERLERITGIDTIQAECKVSHYNVGTASFSVEEHGLHASSSEDRW